MRSSRATAAALLTTIALAAAPAFADGTPSDAESAELMAHGDWARAAAAWRSLIENKPTATRLFNLAQSERNLGHLLEATRRFRQAIDLARRERLPAVEKAASRALAEVEPRLAQLEIVVDPAVDSHAVRIDGIEVTAETAIELDPGERRIMVIAPGHRPFERTVTLGEGEKLRIRATLSPLAPPPTRSTTRPPAAPKPDAPDRTPSASAPPWPVWLLGGIGAASIAGGVAFHFVADSKYDEAASGCRADGDRFICPRTLEDDANHQALKSDAARAETLRNVLVGVGVGALAAGGIWWALSPSSKQRPEIGVAVTPQTASARIRLHVF